MMQTRRPERFYANWHEPRAPRTLFTNDISTLGARTRDFYIEARGVGLINDDDERHAKHSNTSLTIQLSTLTEN
jgi:hypothetical protein